jgi:hypothetical protein
VLFEQVPHWWDRTRAGAGAPVAGSFVFLGLPFLLVTGRGQVRRGDRGARPARAASSAAVSYPLGAVSAAGVAALSAVSAGLGAAFGASFAH